MREAQQYWSRYPLPSPADLPDLGIYPGSSASQVDSLLTELSWKPLQLIKGPFQITLYCLTGSAIIENLPYFTVHLSLFFVLKKMFNLIPKMI